MADPRLSERLRRDEQRLRDLNFLCSGKGGECRCEGCLHRLARADNLKDAARLAELVESWAAWKRDLLQNDPYSGSHPVYEDPLLAFDLSGGSQTGRDR